MMTILEILIELFVYYDWESEDEYSTSNIKFVLRDRRG